MKIQATIKDAITGKNIDLSIPELIVLKGLATSLSEPLEQVKDKNSIHTSVRISAQELDSVVTLLNKITVDVQSLEEARAELFTALEQNERASEISDRDAAYADDLINPEH